MRILYIKSDDKRVQKINNLIEKDFPHLLREKDPELILVSGGDGAMLHAIQSLGSLEVPFLGHAMGSFNFLMNNIEVENFQKTIEDIEEDLITFNEITTSKIKVELLTKESNKPVHIGSAVNEVVLGSSILGYHTFILNSKDETFVNFDIKGSGLCISTDLGSTGYNFNLGGAVLPLGSNLWSLSGIVCNRYLKDILKISELEIGCECERSNPKIFLDGIEQETILKKEDKIILKRDSKITLYFLNKKTFLSKRLEIISRYRRL